MRADGGDDLRGGGRARPTEGEEVGEAVHNRAVLAVVHRGARRAHRVGVLPALVTQRVESRGDDQRWGQAREIVDEERGHLRGGGVEPGSAEEPLFEPGDVAAGEEEPAGEQGLGPGLAFVVGHGIQQHLQARGRHPLLSRPQRHQRREVRPGTVASDGDPVRIGAQLGGVLTRPQVRGVGVLGSGGGRVLGRQAVVDGHHVQTTGATDLTAQVVVGVETAHHMSAAVEEHQQRGAGFGGAIVPGPDRSGGAVHLDVGHRRDRDALGETGGQQLELGPCGDVIVVPDQPVETQCLLAGEHQLQGDVEGVAVEGDRPPTHQQPLDPVGYVRQRTQGHARNSVGDDVDGADPRALRRRDARLRHVCSIRLTRTGQVAPSWRRQQSGPIPKQIR